MNDTVSTKLVRRRELLLARCDAQRAQLALELAAWEVPLKLADGALSGVQFLRRHPLVLGVLALLVATKRRGLWGWAQRGLTLWRTYCAWRGS